MRRTMRGGIALLLIPMLGACAGGDAPADDEAMDAAGDVAATDETMDADATDAMANETMGGLLEPNLASQDELAAVPGMTAEAARAVIDGRPYANALALDAVLAGHLDEAAREQVYAHVWVPLDLNSASEEEILLVPGVGDRMAHEFEEYRPYDGMARFRREMAKYVDDEEVERLAQYVFVPIDLNSATDEQILAIPGVGSRMLREFREYRPYENIEEFRREMGKYVDEDEVARLERYVYVGGN